MAVAEAPGRQLASAVGSDTLHGDAAATAAYCRIMRVIGESEVSLLSAGRPRCARDIGLGADLSAGCTSPRSATSNGARIQDVLVALLRYLLHSMQHDRYQAEHGAQVASTVRA